MRLLFIRHGDPDYVHDSLTEKGQKEVEYLADRLEKIQADAYFLSPLGRAQRTGEATLRRIGKTGKTLDWLQEFTEPCFLPETGEKHLIWDFMPSFMDRYPQLYSEHDWLKVPFIQQSGVPAAYRRVCEGIDDLLTDYGYARKRTYYEVKKANRKTLMFFCHFGATAVILSHLFNMSPTAVMQHFSAAPSSVTTVYTEERECGIASFRCSAYGDISHLYAADEPPAFAGRFCETFDDETERH